MDHIEEMSHKNGKTLFEIILKCDVVNRIPLKKEFEKPLSEHNSLNSSSLMNRSGSLDNYNNKDGV